MVLHIAGKRYCGGLASYLERVADWQIPELLAALPALPALPAHLKASAALRRSVAKHLVWLRERLGERFRPPLA